MLSEYSSKATAASFFFLKKKERIRVLFAQWLSGQGRL